jgi:predicted signal transduction protein with EAL and GGDEF domain
LAEQIVDALGRAFQINGHQIVVGASIGIAVAPRDGDNADLLLKTAAAPGSEGARAAQSATRFAQCPRGGRLSGALSAALQPAQQAHCHLCEALLRWPHPERGMVPPGEFIPNAEEMGLIVEIGRLVLRKACIECARWPNDVRVAVNLSAIQFRRDDMANTIREALQAANLAQDRLEIEITESAFLDDTVR